MGTTSARTAAMVLDNAEKVLGIDLPDDMMEKIIDGVKAKLSLDQAAGLFSAAKKFL